MSQIDVRNAKLALAARLRHWGLEGDSAGLAAGFIDDLVTQGWQMAPFRETRPFPPVIADACHICGKSEDDCRRNRYGAHEFSHIQPVPSGALHETEDVK